MLGTRESTCRYVRRALARLGDVHSTGRFLTLARASLMKSQIIIGGSANVTGTFVDNYPSSKASWSATTKPDGTLDGHASVFLRTWASRLTAAAAPATIQGLSATAPYIPIRSSPARTCSSGRHCDSSTRPGSTGSRPSKNAAISLPLRTAVCTDDRA